MRARVISVVAMASILSACGTGQPTDAESNAEAVAANIEQQADALEAMAAQAAQAAITETSPSVSTAQIRPVCKAAMAQLFGHSPSIMKATGSDDLIRITYRRPDDGKTFTNECKIEGDKIVWRSVNSTPGSGLGPWRTREGDEVLTFRVDGKRVWFTTTYSDGSVTTESQPLV